tara:strand:+ start:72 stop:881 length:810 start_codon:yes stop_codon:yes gene_type:complete
MAKIFIVKPIGFGSSTLLGGCATYSTDDIGNESDTSANVATYLKADTEGYDSIGWTTDSISDSDWNAGSSSNLYGLKIFKVAAFTDSSGTTTTTPSLVQINGSEMVSESWHSNHSNSQNGNEIESAANNYTIDYSAFTITSNNGEVISFDNASTTYTAGNDSNNALRSQNSNNNWYYNGILFESQAAASSGNEYYTDDTFGTTFQYTSPRVFSSGDYSSKVQGTFGGSTFANQGRNLEIDSLTQTDSQKLTALLRAIDIQTYRTFKKEL